LTNEGMRGDINGDGIINVFDVMRYKKKIINGNGIDPSGSTDINRDGAIDESDVSAVMNDALGKSVLWSYGTMPKMESDTVSGQLESVLKSKMLSIGYSNALKLADESGGSDPLKNLISGNTDLVFADSVSEEQKKAAADAGVKLNIVPVAKEGLIFIVNSSNPVDSLTSEQIKGIFSGKITNWKEVGGNDEVIVPFQRNDNAESQKFMKEWMKGELAEALKIGTVNSEYKNLENAIGFTCYTSAAQMYADSPDIKYLAVDGVKPSADTMNDGTYPVLNSISAVYTDKASQNTGNFAAWIMSEEGQTAVADGGFISVKNTEDPVRTKLYTAKGTGKEKPADLVPHWNTQRLYLMSDNYRAFSWDDGMPKSECLLSCLKDKTVQEKINSDISKVMFGDSDVLPGKWGLTAAIFNGYINLTYKEKSGTGKCVKLNYDLRTGDKLEKFSDLFYKDTDFLPLFNRITSRSMAAYSEESFLTDYLGLSDNIRFFDFESVTIFGNGPYTTNDFTLSLHTQYEYEMTGYLVTSEYFDSRDLLEEGTSYKMAVTLTEGSSDEWIDSYSYGKDGKLHYDFISYYHTPEEVEARNHRFDSLHEKVCDLYKKEFPECDDSMLTFSGVRIEDKSGNSFYETNVVDATVQGGESLPVRSYHFDPDTDEPIVLSDVFGKDFEKYDGQYWISYFDLRYGTVDLYDEIGRKYGETVNFSLEDTNVKYLQLHDVYAEELSRVRHGYVSSESALVYPESYVVKFNKEKKGEPVGKGVKTEIRNYVYSLGKKWYECWNADNGDYCGWISEDDITVQNTEEENKLYSSLKFTSFEETPIRGRILSASDRIIAQEQPQDVICYTNESVMDANSELNGSVVPLDNRYAEARNKCLSHGKWLYECWSGGKYIGWVEMHDFQMNELYVYEEEGSFPEKLTSERTGTVPGEKYNGLDFYSPIYIVSDTRINSSAGCVREDIKIRTDKRCLFHGEWWYECSQGGRYLGWINGDLIEFD
ncbi:MAG: substrate-binding domain-containing protein, partial [Oscillospiraceae bacterium]|nr:substrate-binding domain-containing protein [Oscillospiraceae bacterium]